MHAYHLAGRRVGLRLELTVRCTASVGGPFTTEIVQTLSIVRLAAHVILICADIQIQLARRVGAAARLGRLNVYALVELLRLFGRDGPLLCLSVALAVSRALNPGRSCCGL